MKITMLHRILGAALLLASSAALAQKSYPSADAAAEAFTEALRKRDNAAMAVVLGQDWKRYVPGETARADIEAYLAGWDAQHKTTVDGKKAMLAVGKDGWTFPIPIVQGKSGWRFDPKSGADELRLRRIGRNELSTMQAVLAYVDAQRDYALKDRDGNGVLEYAQKFASTAGKKDGLYWRDDNGQDPSPLGPLFAKEQPKGSGGYHGYYYRILKAQGAKAPGGARSYMLNGRMRSGFALVAWPVTYGDTGVMSFIVNHEGKVFEKDLGPQTQKIAAEMKSFNPDDTWKLAETQAK
jgi:hypothetical protein